MNAKAFYWLTLIIAIVGCWLTASFFFGAISPGWLLVIAPISWLLIFALAAISRKTSYIIWIFGGLLTLAALFVPPSTAAGFLSFGAAQSFSSQTGLLLLSIISLALIVAAVLIFSGWNLVRVWQSERKTENEELTTQPHKDVGFAAAITLALSGFLLARALYNFYWFIVWDSTYDPLTLFWLPIPILAVIFASAFLFIVKPPQSKWLAFAYLLLIPALIGVYWMATQVDFRQLTEARAGHIDQAIERYHADKGGYPHNLQQLTPWYLRSIPEPMIIFGQDWCYDSGEGYYRLGYIDREHWSDPRLIGRVYQTQGNLPNLPPICMAEFSAIQARHPNFPFQYWTGDE